MPGTGDGSHKIRVAVVIPTHWDFRMGGSQYQAKLLIEQLYQAHGATITYFTARASSKTQFEDHQVVSVGKIDALRRFGHFWDYFRLQRALQDFSPDVIYQRVGCAYTGISARYARRSGIPLIWHLASASDCSKAPRIGQLLGRPHALIESRLAKEGVAGADVVVAQSADQVKTFEENFGRKVDRLIPNFHRVPPAADKHGGRFTVVWVANLKPVKRPELFLDIASCLKESPEIDFLMIGLRYPSPTLQGPFEKILEQNKNVTFLGAMPQEEVNKLLERSHLLVNTSKSEGYSNTFIQAWMRSVPVLTMGVNPDGILSDKSLGQSHDSIAGIANTIRELASNPDMLADMGTKSRQYAIRHFSMDNAAELADLIVQTAINSQDKPATRSEN